MSVTGEHCAPRILSDSLEDKAQAGIAWLELTSSHPVNGPLKGTRTTPKQSLKLSKLTTVFWMYSRQMPCEKIFKLKLLRDL